MISHYYRRVALARHVPNLLTALAFFALAAPAGAQAPGLFPLDHFWTLPVEAPFAAPPASDDRRVYVPLQTGQLAAFEPGNTDAVWSVELAVDGAPLAADGRIYAPAAGAIHALDAATGAVVWRLPAGPLAAPLAHRAGWLIVALADGGLQAVRASDGVVVWAQAMGAPLAAPPSIDGDLLAAALADGRVALVDMTTGKARWERTLGSRASAVTLSADRIFAGTDDGYFWSIKTRDGDLDWRWRLGARLVGAAAADPERVYIVALDNVVRGFSRGSGHIRWTYPLATRPLGGPMLVEGLLVVTSGDVGAPGLTYINSVTGAAGGKTLALANVDETARVQYQAAVAAGVSPFAVIATATVSGDWQLHAYRQTFLTATAAPITWGKLYEVRLRLEITSGTPLWGTRVTLTPPPGDTAPQGRAKTI